MSDREPTMRELIARSSMGGYAWCFNCKHPDLNHGPNHCHSADGICDCPGLRRMTPEEWLHWAITKANSLDGETP